MKSFDQVSLSFFDNQGQEILDDSGREPLSMTIYVRASTEEAPLEFQPLVKESRESQEKYGEAEIQLLEGQTYEYYFESEQYTLREERPIIQNSRIRRNNSQQQGIISPQLYVGTLALTLVKQNLVKPKLEKQAKEKQKTIVGHALVEVRSKKICYREDYQAMLDFIAQQCTDLLLELRSPVQGLFLPDPSRHPQSLSQQFSFLRTSFRDASFFKILQQICAFPHAEWVAEEHISDPRRGVRGKGKLLQQFATQKLRTPLPEGHPLFTQLPSIPKQIRSHRYRETFDNPENRFVKFVLESLSQFLDKISKHLTPSKHSADHRIEQELTQYQQQLQQALHYPFFREVGGVNREKQNLPLNNPIFQYREGYRELLQFWLRFNMTAKLVWTSGESFFRGGKRNIALLYEYWIFFKLLQLVSSLFELQQPPIEKLIKPTSDGLDLQLRTGNHLSFRGSYQGKNRSLEIQFHYNCTFSGPQKGSYSNYPKGGSWTQSMRPDYTLSLWPSAFSLEQAEQQEIITHIHFDAKYRVQHLEELFGRGEEIEVGEVEIGEEKPKKTSEKTQVNREGFQKMHTYKDAIRRTRGAYVLYPGTQSLKWRGFHEILPGLGAFGIRPSDSRKQDESKQNESEQNKIQQGETEPNGTQESEAGGGRTERDGTEQLAKFLDQVAEYVSTRNTELERWSYHTFAVHEKEKPYKQNKPRKKVATDLSETDLSSPPKEIKRHLPFQETNVIVGWCRSDKQWNWVEKEKLYNVRLELTPKGQPILSPEMVGAKYLFLYTGSTVHGLFQVAKSPQVYSQEVLEKLDYPKPSQKFYLVFPFRPIPEYQHYIWKSRHIPKSPKKLRIGTPFLMTLDTILSS